MHNRTLNAILRMSLNSKHSSIQGNNYLVFSTMTSSYNLKIRRKIFNLISMVLMNHMQRRIKELLEKFKINYFRFILQHFDCTQFTMKFMRFTNNTTH
jgi:hypothetical protein